MSFWTLSNGENIKPTDNFESGGFKLIPDGTVCNAVIEDAAWDTIQPNERNSEPEEYISIKWKIESPSEFKGATIFQKVRCKRSEEKQRDSALQMLVTIDTLAQGRLQKLDGDPTDRHLQVALESAKMSIKVRVWEFGDKSGNWVSGVSKYQKGGADIESDDIPF